MRIWLLRHGQATPYVQQGDHLRELTAHGRAEARAAAVHLPATLTQVLSSPYVRARQTAEEVLAQLAVKPLLRPLDCITPDDDPRFALQQLQCLEDEEFLVVSHQPLIGALSGLLLHGHLQQPVPFHTGTLLCLEGDVLLAGVMELHAIHHPDLR